MVRLTLAGALAFRVVPAVATSALPVPAVQRPCGRVQNYLPGDSELGTVLGTLFGPDLGAIDADDSERGLIFQRFSRSTVAPIGRKKSASTFLLPKKKIHLAESSGWGALAANVGPPGRPRGYQRLTLGQRWVNPRSTLGIFPSHLGPIFADFAGFVD